MTLFDKKIIPVSLSGSRYAKTYCQLLHNDINISASVIRTDSRSVKCFSVVAQLPIQSKLVRIDTFET